MPSRIVRSPTHGSRDARVGALGVGRSDRGGHVAGVHIGKSASAPASLPRRDQGLTFGPKTPGRVLNPTSSR
jgi:hypothetical protein